jgi:hypothetical protein
MTTCHWIDFTVVACNSKDSLVDWKEGTDEVGKSRIDDLHWNGIKFGRK